MQTHKCKSVSEVIAAFEQHKISSRYWFRGESMNYGKTKLLPKIFRPNEKIEENILIEKVQKRFADYRHKIESKTEWLALAQHHTCATRLLDWSGTLLKALYFAVNDNETEDGILYAIVPNDDDNEPKINLLTTLALKPGKTFAWDICEFLSKNDEKIPVTSKPKNAQCNDILKEFILDGKTLQATETTINNCKMPTEMSTHLLRHFFTGVAFYDPPHLPDLNERLTAQDGKFTIHGGKVYNSSQIIKCSSAVSTNNPSQAGEFLTIIIEANTKENIKKELRNTHGIDEFSLFPDNKDNRVKDIYAMLNRN